MSYSQQGIWLPSPVFITPWSRQGSGAYLGAVATGTPVSATWPTTDRAYYYPIHLWSTITAYRLFVLNGATVGTNNWDIGLYTADTSRLPATRIVSNGGTVSAGANVLQFFDIADTVLYGPALYYIGLAMNGQTDTAFRTAGGSTASFRYEVFNQNTAYPLPATAAPAVSTTNPWWAVCGIATRSTP